MSTSTAARVRVAASPRPVPSTYCYAVVALREPGVLPSIANVLAKRGLVAHRIYANAVDAAESEMHIDLQVSGLDTAQGLAVARDLGRVIGVRTVLTAERQAAE